MSIINTARKQTAVWWSREKQPTDKFGKMVTCAPREIRVRWDDKVEQFIDATGSPQMSKAMVMIDFTLDVIIGDFLKLCRLDQIEDLEVAPNNIDGWEIKGLQTIPNLKNTESLVIAIL